MSRTGYIYKLCCDGIDDFYIGSSWDMYNRKSKHNGNCNNQENPSYHLKVYKYIRENKGIDNWKFEILETSVFQGKLNMVIREQYYIDLLKPSLNMYSAYRTREDYIKYHKEYSRKYRNKEGYKEYVREYNKKPEMKEYHKEYKLTDKYKQKAKEYSKTQLETKLNCPCGSITNKVHKKRHETTQKHLNYLSSLGDGINVPNEIINKLL